MDPIVLLAHWRKFRSNSIRSMPTATLILKTNGREVPPSTRIIEATDNYIPFLACYVSAVGPTGEYRKGHPDQCPNICPHDHPIHTRTHILTECHAYMRTLTTIRGMLTHDDPLVEIVNLLNNNNGAFSLRTPHTNHLRSVP